MNPEFALDLARAILALAFLFYASWSDSKTREVSNTVWLIFAPFAFILTFAEILLYQSSQLIFFGICVGLTTLFAFDIFYAGGFGGADAKALMCLALAVPFYPVSLFSPIGGPLSPILQVLFPLSVFSNSVLIAALMTLVLLTYNVLWRMKKGIRLFENYENGSLGRKALVLVTGYKVSIEKLKGKWHVYPLEDVSESTENGLERKLVLIPKDEGRDEIVNRLDNALQKGQIQDAIWASPGLPFLIFITAGFAIALFIGDIIWIFIRLALA